MREYKVLGEWYQQDENQSTQTKPIPVPLYHKSYTGLQLNSGLWRDRWATTLGMAQSSWKQNPL